MRNRKHVSCFARLPCSSFVKTNTPSPIASQPQLLNEPPSAVGFEPMFSGLSIAPPDWPAMKKKWFG